MTVPLVPGPGPGDANAARKPMSALPESQCDLCAVLIEPKQSGAPSASLAGGPLVPVPSVAPAAGPDARSHVGCGRTDPDLP